MKKRGFFSLILCLLLILQMSALQAYATEPTQTAAATDPSLADQQADLGSDASIVNGCNGIEAKVPLRSEYILDTAQCAMLFELNSKTMVYSFNVDAKIYPGGFTKLLTALIAIENGNLQDTVTVTQEDLDMVPEDSLETGIKLGEEFTLEQILYALVLHSGNDAAVVVANHISGSQEAFVELMNKKAKELGCTATNFVNTHGVHDEAQYTTVRDLARILSYAVENESFFEVFSAPKYEIAQTNMSTDWLWHTRNYMLSNLIMDEYYDYRVTGGASASDYSGLRSSVCVAEVGDLKYLAFVTGTKPVLADDAFSIKEYNEFREMELLLDLGFDGYEVKQILFEGQITSQFTVSNGTNSVAAGPDRSVVTVIPENMSLNDLTIKYQQNANGTLYAPIEKGQRLDVVQIWLGNVCLGQADLYAMNSSRVFTGNSEEENTALGDGITTGLIIFGILIGVVLLLAGVLYIVRFVNISMYQNRSRRRRNSRRRSR